MDFYERCYYVTLIQYIYLQYFTAFLCALLCVVDGMNLSN